MIDPHVELRRKRVAQECDRAPGQRTEQVRGRTRRLRRDEGTASEFGAAGADLAELGNESTRAAAAG